MSTASTTLEAAQTKRVPQDVLHRHTLHLKHAFFLRKEKRVRREGSSSESKQMMDGWRIDDRQTKKCVRNLPAGLCDLLCIHVPFSGMNSILATPICAREKDAGRK